MTYTSARNRIATTRGFLDVDLVRFLLHANGYQTGEHKRFWLNLGMRPLGESRWLSVPNFAKFDEARDFLLDDNTRVEHLIEQTDGRWFCVLGCNNTSGSSTGYSPGYALAAAWLDLQLSRTARREKKL